ncbi:MAD3 protein, partial [Buphagus erythrorhynchus]|nr:MAD3 protein [Buphagus erythrorhynchus]
MEPAATSIQVLLQAAEFLEHCEHRYPLGLAEAEHGYAALCPAPSRRAVGSVRADLRDLFRRSVHNALEKHRYGGVGGERWGRGWLEEQELRARRAKDRLRDRQRSLQQRLELLLLPTDGERARADSLDSSRLSEPSEEEDAEVEVDGVVFSGDLLPSFGTGRDHSYSSPHSPAS